MNEIKVGDYFVSSPPPAVVVVDVMSVYILNCVTESCALVLDRFSREILFVLSHKQLTTPLEITELSSHCTTIYLYNSSFSRLDCVSIQTFARVGLLGNPSDGYEGKTLSCTIDNYAAQVSLSPSIRLTFPSDISFESIHEFETHVQVKGYPSGDCQGSNLLMASFQVFLHSCREHRWLIPCHHFSIDFSTLIPRQVGLAGSSAICTSAFKAFFEWFGLEPLAPAFLARAVWLVESKELNVTCGLQDRVVQAFDGLVSMDFTPSAFAQNNHKCGLYTELVDVGTIAFFESVHLFLLFSNSPEKDSGKVHAPIRERWLAGEDLVQRKMCEIASLVDQGCEAIRAMDRRQFVQLMNQNFDLRLEVFGELAVAKEDREMIARARSFGPNVGAKLPGSGGCVLAMVVEETFPTRFETFMLDFNVSAIPVRLRLGNQGDPRKKIRLQPCES